MPQTTRLSKSARVGVALLLCLFLIAQAHAQSALDGFDPRANGTVHVVVVVQPDGKILLGGSFLSLSPNGGPAVARNGIARVNIDGTLDTAFNPNANGTVRAIVLQPDGKMLVAGSFHGANSIGGQTRNYIARLDPVTGEADSFDPDANAEVFAIALQPDGKILASGSFSGANSIGGQARNYVARLDPTTGLADSFDPNANAVVSSIAVQADGRILVGGSFSGSSSIGGQDRNHIARLDPASGLADSFDPDADDDVLALAVQPDGNVLVGGLFAAIGGQPRNRIARLDSTTGEADSFDPHASHSNPGYSATVNSIALQSDGKIIAGGSFTNVGGQTRNNIARIDPITGLADSFNPNANDVVYTIAVQADGKILTGGNFLKFKPNGGQEVFRSGIARLETDGRVDRALGDVIHGYYQRVYASAVQPDGKILIGGGFFEVAGAPRKGMARLNPDGTLDTAFDPNLTGPNNSPYVASIAVEADGKILVSGRFDSVGGQPRNHIARLDPTTGQADSFNPNAAGIEALTPFVGPMVVQADGRILVGGSFTSIGGQMRNNIARLDPVTGLADSFDPNAVTSGNGSAAVHSIAIQADGKILVCGSFNSIGGQPRKYLARLDPVSGLADSFTTSLGANSSINLLVVQRDGKILVAGYFSLIGGQTRQRIARLDPETGLADSFDPNPTGNGGGISAIVLQTDGKILVGGGFTSIGGQPRHGFARLDPTTGMADSFNPDPTCTQCSNNGISSIAMQPDGRILLGGFLYTDPPGSTQLGFARFTNDTVALQNLFATPTTVTWTRSGSSPELSRATFEYSSDNANYTALGDGIPQTASGTWTLAGLSLPLEQNFYVRARGYYRDSGSESVTESVRNVFLPGAPPTPTPTPAPSPTSTPTPTATPSATATPTSTVSPTPGPTSGSLRNISTRARVQTGDNALIGGFIITGTQPKKVILRGRGPSLSGFGIADPLHDPVIELFGSSNNGIAANDDWQVNQRDEIIATGLAPESPLESAIVQTLLPGAYTVVVRGKKGDTGTGLFEAYDLDAAADSKLANVSTRGFVGTGDNVMIGGIIIAGNAPAKMLFRAIGPSLTSFGVPNALPDPTLELYNANGQLIAINYNWRNDQAAEIIATGLAPSNDRESALLRDLAPGNYTAIVRSADNTTGVALIEAYELD